MKTDEVLERYREGERDFRRVNLRGQSFKGKNLSRADFSEADIRGASFTNANLSGANFHGALAGLQHRWTIGLLLASWLISGISASFSLFPGYFVLVAFDTRYLHNFSTGITPLIAITVLFIFTIRYGLAAGFVAGAFAVAFAFAFTVAFAFAGAVAGAVAVAFALLGTYIGWRGMAGDEKHAWVRPIAIAFAATGGTSFRGANLTDADFTFATLKNTDIRGAILTRTSWKQAEKLDRVRPGTTYLRNVQLRQWLIVKGQNKNFDRQDLRGVNLKGANLADASFIAADPMSDGIFDVRLLALLNKI